TTPVHGSDVTRRDPGPTAGWSLTGALTRFSLWPVGSPGRTGGGGVMLALCERPGEAVTPAPTEFLQGRLTTLQEGWCPSDRALAGGPALPQAGCSRACERGAGMNGQGDEVRRCLRPGPRERASEEPA